MAPVPSLLRPWVIRRVSSPVVRVGSGTGGSGSLEILLVSDRAVEALCRRQVVTKVPASGEFWCLAVFCDREGNPLAARPLTAGHFASMPDIERATDDQGSLAVHSCPGFFERLGSLRGE